MEDIDKNNLNTTVSSDAQGAVVGENNVVLDVCKKQAEEYLNNWKRERADFVNYKKDEGKRMEEFIKFANESLILEFLETMDDLYLAAKDLKNEGLEHVIKKFEDLLKKYGVEKIKIGDKFDPMYHEIVTTETQNELETQKGLGTQEKEEKIEEVRAGYTMYGRVKRPARVKIIK